MSETVTDEQAGAGWYIHPSGPPNQLRWWDGGRWTDAVQVLPPWPTVDSSRASRPRRLGRTMAWGALGAFLLAAGGAAYAMLRGQDVCEVSATGLTFCTDGGGDTPAIDGRQDSLAAQAATNEEQARDTGLEAARVDAVELSGVWSGENGFTYTIEQFGDSATVTESTPDGLITATGIGMIEGAVFAFDYTAADSSVGTGVLELVEARVLEGSFHNLVSGLTVAATLTR